MVERTQLRRGPSGRIEVFQLASKCIWIFLVASVITLATVIGTAVLGGRPSIFMWVRAVILIAVAPLLLRLASRAAAGSDAAVGRLTFIATVLPIAVIVVDFIPGVAPTWYGVIQGLGALMLVPVALFRRRWAEPVAAQRPDGR